MREYICITSKEGYEAAKKDGMAHNFRKGCFTDPPTKDATLEWNGFTFHFMLFDRGRVVLHNNKYNCDIFMHIIDHDHFGIDEAVYWGKRAEKANRYLKKYDRICSLAHLVAVYEYEAA